MITDVEDYVLHTSLRIKEPIHTGTIDDILKTYD